MAESLQKWISRNRPPRVQIEYDVELYGSEKKVQLPFVMGVLADLSGKSADELPSVAERKALQIDVDNFDERLKSMKPKVQFTVPNTISGEGNLAVDITFESMDDFSPAAVARKVDALNKLLEARTQLANLKTYRFSDEDIARLQTSESSAAISSTDRYHICFALGKAFEDRKDYEQSWRYYAQGNALKRAESKYRADILEQNTRNQKRVCTQEFFAARSGWGCQSPDPIFILGLPRAGSTLLEQILASHPMVEGTQELANIPRYALQLQGLNPDLDNPLYPKSLLDLTREEVERFGQQYIDDTRIYRTTPPYFIDKMPNNFRHIGLIKLILPNAKIIDARREPMACCFGNLKQLFARGQEFCYSVDDIARYYRTYLELMKHWEEVLPGQILRVHHEDVVDDLEGSVRRLLEFLGLPFEQACLEFHKNVRSVKTASSEQVRQPIYREGLDQWRRYEPWLSELREKLGDAITRYRD